jgi:hypothetical protein
VETDGLNNLILLYMSKDYVVHQIFMEMEPRPKYYRCIQGTWESFEVREGFSKPTKEVFEAKFRELYALEPMRRLREKRDYLISQTDWIFAPDVPPMTEEKFQEWKTYRQALRDLPSGVTPTLDEDGLELLDVTWPTVPA